MLKCQQEWGDAFAKKGLLLAPNVAQCTRPARSRPISASGIPASTRSTSWCSGKGSRPTPRRRRSSPSSRPAGIILSRRSWSSGITGATGGAGSARNGDRRAVGRHRAPVWFKNDPRVANVKAMGGVLSRPVMEGVVATTQMVKEKHQAAAARPARGRARQRSRPACRLPCRRARSARQHLDRLGRTRARSVVRIASSTVTATSSKPACCRPIRPSICCNGRRSRSVSHPPAELSATGSTLASCAHSGWS